MLTPHEASELDENRALRKSLIRGLLYLFVTLFLVTSIAGLGYLLEVFKGNEDIAQIHTFDRPPPKKAFLDYGGIKVAHPDLKDQQINVPESGERTRVRQTYKGSKYKYEPTTELEEQLSETDLETESTTSLSRKRSVKKRSSSRYSLPAYSYTPITVAPIAPIYCRSIADPNSLIVDPAQGKPRGLVNEGNYCYFNSLLQSLAAVFKYMDVKSELSDSAHLDSFRLLVNLMQDILAGGEPFSSKPAADYFLSIGGPDCVFKNKQQDSHEAWTQLYDMIVRKRQNNSIGDFEKGFQVGITLKNVRVCGHVTSSIDFQPYLNVSFPGGIRPSQAFRLKELIRTTLAIEPTEGPLECEMDKTYSPAMRHSIWSVFPNILIIPLLRFTFSKDSKFTGKILNRVLIPEELDYWDYEGNQIIKYRLKAFTMHTGSSAKYGHYYSIVRYHDKWYECNDRAVNEVSILNYPVEPAVNDPDEDHSKETGKVHPKPTVQSAVPYLIFYVKEGVKQFDPKVDKEKVEDPLPDDPEDHLAEASWMERFFGVKEGSVPSLTEEDFLEEPLVEESSTPEIPPVINDREQRDNIISADSEPAVESEEDFLGFELMEVPEDPKSIQS